MSAQQIGTAHEREAARALGITVAEYVAGQDYADVRPLWAAGSLLHFGFDQSEAENDGIREGAGAGAGESCSG